MIFKDGGSGGPQEDRSGGRLVVSHNYPQDWKLFETRLLQEIHGRFIQTHRSTHDPYQKESSICLDQDM